MCECGCSMDRYDYRMPGPDGKVYALRVYTGCQGCCTPAGVDISLVNPQDEDGQMYDLDQLCELPVVELETVGVAVVQADVLLESLRRTGFVDADTEDGVGPPWAELREAVGDTHAKYCKLMKESVK